MVDVFRPWVEKAAEDKMDHFFETVKKSTGKDDAAVLNIWMDYRREVRKTGERMPLVDTDFTLSLIPLKRSFIGICYTESQAWFDAWCQQPGVQEYGYWDNADEPEGMSRREWNQRAKNWDILTGDPVSMQAFSIELVSPHGPLMKGWRA